MNDGETRSCPQCGQSRFEKHASVHVSERAVVYYNPATGEHRTPPRADTPMPAVYAGSFERREIMNMGAWEKESGTVHEATSYNPGNEPMESAPEKPVQIRPEAKRALVDDLRAAISSGPWTDSSGLLGLP